MIIIALAIFGIIFGSFVNALVWRLHEQAALGEGVDESDGVATRIKTGTKNHKAAGINKKQKIKSKAQPAGKGASLSAQDLSIATGRSMCPHCHHTLAAKDLVPVLSWLQLRGRCRYCAAPIGWQYPAVELLTGALFALSYAAWPYATHGVGLFQLVVWLVFVVFFVALAVYDLRWFLLPDRIVRPLVLLAVAQTVVVAIWLHRWNALWEPAVGAAIIFGLFWTLFQVSKGVWIGGGDVKLALVLGLLAATPLQACLVIFLASLLGTIGSIPELIRGKQGLKARIPFGPYLLAATVITVLYGTHITNWYQNLFTL